MSEVLSRPPGRPPSGIRTPGPGANGEMLAQTDAFMQSGGIVGQAPSAMVRLRVPGYNAEQAETALAAMKSGITLREHCRLMRLKDSSYPVPETFYAWAVDNVDGFAGRYAYARRMLLQHWAEEIVEIAEDGRNDWIERRKMDGTITKQIDHECVQRSKLRIDTRRWLLAKLLPHEYGDKVMHQQLGANGMPVDPPSAVSPIDLSVELRGWKPRD